MPRKIDKKSIKIIELILGATTWGFKYQRINEVTTGNYYLEDSMKLRSVTGDLLWCVTYCGLLFLKSMAVISAISGQIPKGNYVKYFHVTGSAAYIGAEALYLLGLQWDKMDSVSITFPIIGTIVTVILIIVLLLDCFNII